MTRVKRESSRIHPFCRNSLYFWRYQTIILGYLIPSRELFPCWRTRCFCNNRLIEWFLYNGQNISISRIDVLSKRFMESIWIKVQKSCAIICNALKISLWKFRWNLFKESVACFPLIRSKCGNVDKTGDIRIIITSICNYLSTIWMSNKNCWSANPFNCALYCSDVIFQRM